MNSTLKTGDSIHLQHGGARQHNQQLDKLPQIEQENYSNLHKLAGFIPNDQTASLELQCHVGSSTNFVSDASEEKSPTTSLSGSSNVRISCVKAESSLVEEEAEIINNQSLLWLKSDGQSDDLDMLEIEAKHPSSLSSMEVVPEFSETVNEFIYSASMSDSSMTKQNVGANYFEGLENTDNINLHMTWNTNQIDGQNTRNSQLTSSTGVFVSLSDDALEESVNNASAISCSTRELNSILFENIPHDIGKQDSSSVEIMQYTDSLNFPADRAVICSEDSAGSVNALSSSSSSDLKSLHLSLSGAMADQNALPSLSDSTSDACLSSLPNFLGLETRATSGPASSGFVDGALVNILEGIGPSLAAGSHVVACTDSLEGPVSQDVDSNGQLRNSSLCLTTISISKDDENSTKILVDSHQGQQQMYIINTADLNHTHPGDVGQGNIFVINASDLTPGSGGTFISSSMEGGAENAAVKSQPAAGQVALKAASIPGFVLLPVMDSAANMIQAVPVQLSDGDSSSKKPKKLLMCAAAGCRKAFKKASKLKVHQMLHTGERPFKCTLLGCEWAFTTSNKLKRHMESHVGRKDYICDKAGCGHRFTTVYNLNTHRKLHDRPCTETCPEDGCNQRFATKRQLELHLRNIHACEERTFKCPEPGCEKVFFSSGCMGSHMKVHQQNAEELRCKVPGCGKEFTKMCRLRQHERLHSGEKPFVCDYQGCTWAFPTASKLKRHQTKHTGLRKWVCEVCKKQFHRSEHLKGHLIIHSGDRPFICPVEGCGNTFTAKSSLYVHLKKHDESGKTIVYHCPMEKCEKHYANKATLRQHILVKHCSISQKGALGSNQGVVGWLSLLGSGDASSDIILSQESFGDGLAQVALTQNQDSVLPTDFLTGGISDQTLLHSSNEMPPSSGLISKLVVPTGASVVLTSPAPSAAAAELPLQTHFQQVQQQQMFSDDQADSQLLEAGEVFQQQERMSFEAVERGKKSQIMLENMHGSARTDPRSNDIISQRSLKRWQKQKEIEAAKLRVKLDASSSKCSTSHSMVVMSASGDYNNIVSNNVSLAGHQILQKGLIHHSLRGSPGSVVKASSTEVPDMELQGDVLSDSVLDGASSADSFLTELFIRDPETGITYRQTQLLQDDPPNPEISEDMESVATCSSMVLDPSLDPHFVEDSLSFNQLE